MKFASKTLLAAIGMTLLSPVSATWAATPQQAAKKPAAKPVARATAVVKTRTVVKPGTRTSKTAVKATARTAARPGVKTTAKTPAKAVNSLVWNSVTQGFAAAKKSNKPILVDFYTDWCGWCKVMDEVTFQHPPVKTVLSKQFVLVRANAEDGADGEKLARDLEIRGFPTTMLFDPTGKPKTMMVGFIKPENFATKIDEFLKGKTEATASESAAPTANEAGSGTPSTPFKE